ncbi:MAG: AraC family transcriptional regulator [Cyclobacteriaceae bacterium]
MNHTMRDIIHVSSVDQVTRTLVNSGPDHPLISIIDFSEVAVCGANSIIFTSDLYIILLKDRCDGDMLYGRENYDFQDGVLSFFAPGQVISIEPNTDANLPGTGWGVFVHADFIAGTSLGSKIKEYSFFGYAINEALHASEKEKQTLMQCIGNIRSELGNNMDPHSEELVVSNLDLLLNYCTRYFNRQFLTRKKFTSHIVQQFEDQLVAWFLGDQARLNGLPTVKYLAGQVHLSPNYLSDYLKSNTGFSAQEHIQRKLIEEAKTRLLSRNGKTINEVAYELGFDNPPYFTRLFKKRVGVTPTEFLSVN